MQAQKKKNLMLFAVGYCLAVFIGFCLGLIGGGGSILVIPVLVIFFGIDPVPATTYSLCIVGLTALAGAVGQVRNSNVDYSKLLQFGITSVLSLFIVRRWIMPLIPETIFRSDSFLLSRAVLVMVCFSLLMLIAGIKMIKPGKLPQAAGQNNPVRLALQGIITGAITGFIGIGGGFIIVPSLVLFAGLSMKKAIGTSLFIITVNCLVGLLTNISEVGNMDYNFLTLFCALTITGIIFGTWLTKYIPDKNLKPAFGWIIIGMSTIVFLRSFIH